MSGELRRHGFRGVSRDKIIPEILQHQLQVRGTLVPSARIFF
jgi:hypothetical protein